MRYYIIIIVALFCLNGVAQKAKNQSSYIKDGHRVTVHGAIIRMDTLIPRIYLVFTGHEYSEGVEIIAETLRKNTIKAGFFFTGDFYRNYPDQVRMLRDAGHYMGPHSDKHLLYVSWEKRDSLLVTKETFLKDLKNNYFTSKNEFAAPLLSYTVKGFTGSSIHFLLTIY